MGKREAARCSPLTLALRWYASARPHGAPVGQLSATRPHISTQRKARRATLELVIAPC